MSDREGMACRELVELVTDYLEAALAPAERARFEAHLAECGGCATYLAQMKQVVRLSRRAGAALPDDPIDPAARERMLDLFRSWTRG
jgi:anti-sigma factor RsiW